MYVDKKKLSEEKELVERERLKVKEKEEEGINQRGKVSRGARDDTASPPLRVEVRRACKCTVEVAGI